MATKGTLFKEALALYHSLLELYFETNELWGPSKYNSWRVAESVQKSMGRLARRRDQFINGAEGE